MTPSSTHLAWSALGELLRLQQAAHAVDSNQVVEGVRVALNELLLRENLPFFDDFIACGRILAEEGRATLGVAYRAHLPEMPSHDLPRDAAMVALTTYNESVVRYLPRLQDVGTSALIDRILDWELSLYAARTKRVDSAIDVTLPLVGLNAASLQTYLRNHRSEWRDASVKRFRIQPGGYSKITVLADWTDASAEDHSVVLRAQPARRMLDLDGMHVALEYPLVRYLHSAGLPVAEPLFVETDPRHMGMQFMASRRMPGVIIGTYKGSERAVGTEKLRAVTLLIAQIAKLPLDAGDPLIRASYLQRWMSPASLPESTHALIRYWQEAGVAGNAQASPLLTHGVEWLLGNVPAEDAAPCLVHGDIGFHNILFEDGNISALLDWENSRFGDPAEDLSLFITASVGQVDREQIMSWYREAGGPAVSESRLRYFEVFHCVKVIISALTSLRRVDEEPIGSLSLATFGLQFLHFFGLALPGLIRAAEVANAEASI